MRPLRHRFYTYRSANRHLLRETVYLDMQTTEEINMEMNDLENAVFRRGEIYDIGELDITGSEQQGNRPVLIVSADDFNDRSPEVIIVFITSQLDKKGSRYHINLPGVIGLEKKSMVLAEQIRTADKSRMLGKRGQLDLMTMNRVDRGLKTILDLNATKENKKVKEEEKKEKMKTFTEWKKLKQYEEEVRRSKASHLPGRTR